MSASHSEGVSRAGRPRSKPSPLLKLAVLAALFPALLLTGCSGAPSILDPQGLGAARIGLLWWVMLGMAAGVFLVVEGLLLYAVVRYQRNRPEGEPRQVYNNMLVEVSAAAFPAVVLAGLFVVTFITLAALSEPPQPAEFTVEVAGNQWWWEVRYPEQGVVTANEIHVPAGRSVRVQVTSNDVIHSFWVPQLQPKIDMIPGHTSATWLYAEQPGAYRGQCAEFCGLQHSHMAFHVVVQPPEEMEAWLAGQRQPARTPTDPLARQGMELFMTSGCAACHTIRGTDAQGKLGPDLTHVGSREWIGAGTLRNNRANLAHWINDNQRVKPGNQMPDFDLPPDVARAIATYLSGLDADQEGTRTDAD